MPRATSVSRVPTALRGCGVRSALRTLRRETTGAHRSAVETTARKARSWAATTPSAERRARRRPPDPSTPRSTRGPGPRARVIPRPATWVTPDRGGFHDPANGLDTLPSPDRRQAFVRLDGGAQNGIPPARSLTRDPSFPQLETRC